MRVDSVRTPADLPPGPAGGWWNFGGILREVYLRAVREADISRMQVRTACPARAARPRSPSRRSCATSATSRQAVTLTGRYGTLDLMFGSATLAAGATWTANATATLTHPRLWSIGRPYLYRAALTLTNAAGARLGGYVTYSGVRTITVNRSGHLMLNGRALHLRGVNLHEQDLRAGAALDPAHLRTLMGWVKALGAHMIRAHYPLNPELEEMADRNGILLWSEVPVYGTNTAYLGRAPWLAQARRVLTENILTNQNHPSLALWSIGNELDTPRARGGGTLHRRRGRAGAPARSDPAGRHGGERLAGRAAARPPTRRSM